MGIKSDKNIDIPPVNISKNILQAIRKSLAFKIKKKCTG